MAKIVLDPVTGGYDLSVINNNFDKIESEFQNEVLYRNNPTGEPNTLESNIDANGKRIFNLPQPTSGSEPLRASDVFADFSVGAIRGPAEEEFTASAGQTVFTLASPYVVGANAIIVHINGIYQHKSTYAESSPTSITLTEGARAGDKVVISPVAILIDSLPGGGSGNSGEVNTASNLAGTGEGVFAQKVGVDLQFKKIRAGTNVSISSDSTGIVINSTSPGGGGSFPFLDIKADYGAIGDGVADDKPAFDLAQAAGKPVFVPEGNYKIVGAVTYTIPLIGVNATYSPTVPASTFLRNQLEIGKRAVSRTVYRDSAEYTDTPTSYTNLFTQSVIHLDHFNAMGYQQFFTSDSGGRTMVPGYSLNGSHSGYGDVCAFYGNYGVSKHPSSASISNLWTGANSATVVAGQVGAVTDKVNLYGSEFHMDDGNFPTVNGIGAVYNFVRNNSTFTPYNTLWAGVRVQTAGTKPIDVGYQLSGKATIGLDFSGVDFEQLNGSVSKAAICLKANDRINFNVAKKTVPNWHAFQGGLPPETYLTFDGTKYVFTTNSVAHFQTSDAATVIVGGTSIYKGASLIFDAANADASKIFIGNTGFNVSINQRLHLTSQTTASSATAGVASALPAAPFTYLTINIDGSIYKIPVYNN